MATDVPGAASDENGHLFVPRVRNVLPAANENPVSGTSRCIAGLTQPMDTPKNASATPTRTCDDGRAQALTRRTVQLGRGGGIRADSGTASGRRRGHSRSDTPSAAEYSGF